MKIISPKYDFCMKLLFENETVRIYFLSAVLDIPVAQIHSARLRNPFLLKRRRNRKEGILDVLVELEDGTKIDIEIQGRLIKHWDKRQIFYLSKLYTADLHSGEDYGKIKKCISIGILDFNLTDREEYHTIYRLRDRYGNEFSDSFEIHTIELRKKLNGQTLDEWITLFNTTTMEELDMIKTKNPGIQEAIRQLKEMSLPYRLRVYREYRLKAIRDQRARDEYVHDEAIEIGVKALIETCQDMGMSKENTYKKIAEKFTLSADSVNHMMQKYWR